MNYFEQELRKLMALGAAPKSTKATFTGRACYLTLSETRRARIEFKTCGIADHYEAILVTILATDQGTIDSNLLRFEDFFTKQYNGCGTKVAPHIWNYRDEPTWCLPPAPAEVKALAGAAKEYIDLFA